MFKRVLILSVSAGAGHVRAAQAIEKAFAETGMAQEVRHVDVLQLSNLMVRDIYSKRYLDMVNKAPAVLGWLYDRADIPWRGNNSREVIDTLNTLPLLSLLHKYKPDLIICTHFLPAGIISRLKAQGRLNTRHAIVVTDMDAHAMWLCSNHDNYFVPLEETKRHLASVGIKSDAISVTGIPVDPIFASRKDKAAMRLKHGLEPDLPAILLSAGGHGVGPVEKLIDSLLKLEHPVQIVVVCGKNKRLKEKLSQRASSDVQLKVIGFTENMDELMAACDLFVGKAGGLTTSEALAKGLPLVIVNPIPGQEERNSDHYLEEGVAIRCNNLPVLAYKIDRLLSDEERFKTMQHNAQTLGKPRAAYDLVMQLAQAGPLPDNQPRRRRYDLPRLLPRALPAVSPSNMNV